MRLLLVILLTLFTGGRAVSVELPPIPPERRMVYDTLYKMEFLEDGMPGRRTENGVVPHPIYPTYVVDNFIREWRLKKDRSFLDGAETVMNAALSRMEDFKGSLVFWYTPEMGLTALPGKFYSGLTQARYLQTLEMLARETGDKKYLDAAERVLTSLMIPVAEGGVARESHGGMVIEEWPHGMMSIYTLNGWTTAMVLLADYAEKTGSKRAKEFFDQNVTTLEALIQNFDAEELANTRYNLAGYAYMRVRFPGAEGQLHSAQIDIPDEGTFPVTDTADKTRWTNFVMGKRSGRLVRMNVVLNRASAPKPNVFRARVSSAKARVAEVQILGGHYVPTQTRQENTDWLTLGKVEIGPKPRDIEVSIPWEKADLIAYPTAFTKKIGGKSYNSYHYIHMRQVRRIAKVSGSAKLAAYADKWDEYPARWPAMPVYRDAQIELRSYGQD